uniref:Uncharacterized protein n=1 Tax=Monopterus albus TaxID=43700 RepID=A0A3Q3JVE2_MONAL
MSTKRQKNALYNFPDPKVDWGILTLEEQTNLGHLFMFDVLILQESDMGKYEIQPTVHWQEIPLCHYTMDRLFSFSILTARVFAVGDPAHHTQGLIRTCRPLEHHILSVHH